MSSVLRTRLSRGGLLFAVAFLLFAGPAVAAAIPGATYTGQADGGSISFTVSSDGTSVVSYVVNGAQGHTPDGGGCRFLADEQPPAFNGVPITNNAFSYQVTNTILFQGTFGGPQSANGTFDFDSPPIGTAPGCNTGTVDWTATTTASPTTTPTGSSSGAFLGSGMVKIAGTAHVGPRGVGAFRLIDIGAAAAGKVKLTIKVRKRIREKVKEDGRIVFKTVFKAETVTVASFSFSLAAGGSTTHHANLSSAALKLLDGAHGRRMKVTATIDPSTDPAYKATVTLIGAKPAPKKTTHKR
jgi:hypothetical protein